MKKRGNNGERVAGEKPENRKKLLYMQCVYAVQYYTVVLRSAAEKICVHEHVPFLMLAVIWEKW